MCNLSDNNKKIRVVVVVVVVVVVSLAFLFSLPRGYLINTMGGKGEGRNIVT